MGDLNAVQTDLVDISDVMRARRAEMGMSQAELARTAEVNVRQIARYESGEQQPTLSVAVQLAAALDISLAQLAGQYNHDLDLDGTWWAGWQTSKDGEPWVAIQRVKIHQHGQHLQVDAERSRPVEEGGYNWTGELRLWDGTALIGWYRADDAAVRSKGSMYFALHAQGRHALGRWVGQSYDGDLVTGYGSLARDQDKASEIIYTSIEQDKQS